MELTNFTDYRQIIRKWVEKKPGKGRGEFAKMADLLSIPASVFSQILNGQRDLAPDNAYLLSEYMGLLPLEQDYFVTLVQIEKSYHHKYKNHLKEKLKAIKQESLNLSKRVSHETVLNEQDQQIFYSSWLYSAIRLRTSLKDGASLMELKDEFRLSKERLLQILDFLASRGLVSYDGDRYQLGTQRTYLSRNSPMISKHHSNWRIRSLEKSSELTESELMFTGPLTCSQSDFLKIREKMAALISEVSDIVKDSPAEELAYMGLDFYRI